IRGPRCPSPSRRRTAPRSPPSSPSGTSSPGPSRPARPPPSASTGRISTSLPPDQRTRGQTRSRAMTDVRKKGVSRRAVLKGSAAVAGLAAGSGAITGFPTIWAQNIKNVTLRQFGTGVSNLNAVADKVKEDLGFTLQMTALDSDAVAQRAVTQPDSYDIADIEYWICKKVFPAGVMQPMDTMKMKYFDKIVPLFVTG